MCTVCVDAEFGGEFIFAVRSGLVPQSDQVVGRRRRHSRAREGSGSTKKGAILTCPPKCPHCLDTEFGGDFAFAARRDRILALAEQRAA